MKLFFVLLLCIGFVQGLEDVVARELSTASTEEGGFQLAPAWLEIKATAVEEDQSNRFLGGSTCRTCKKKYLYKTDCEPKYQNPAMHRNYKTKDGCEYTCCTDVEDDPACCRFPCDKKCEGEYVLNGSCKKGYKAVRKQWGSFEIGPDGPTGYREAKGKKFYFKNARCYWGCCSNDIAGTGCCVHDF
jgi:hypothetical protein